jgi:DNA-binding transcriptional regulator YiaG
MIGPSANATAADRRRRTAARRRTIHPPSIFVAMRTRLGLTQAEAARMLGISRKAVESYEQGWRSVPRSVFNELITILAVRNTGGSGARPCWQIVRCSPAARSQCLAFRVTQGRLCWVVGQATCERAVRAGPHGLAACLECPVVRRLM